MTWICPNCKRRFKNPNQQHSCIVTDNVTPFIKNLRSQKIGLLILFTLNIFSRWTKN